MSTTQAPDRGIALPPVLTSVLPKRWAPRMFTNAPPGSLRRRPSDAVRAVTAAVLVTLTAVWATHASKVQQEAYDFLTDLPDVVHLLLAIPYCLVIAAPIAILIAALAIRRWRLVGSMLVASALTLAVAAWLLSFVDDHGPGYPALSLAMLVAALLAATPYLSRPLRRTAEVLILFGALTAIPLGQGLPVAVFGALALGWGAAALVRLVTGSPAGTPSSAEVAASLAELGLAVDGLALDPEQVWGESRYRARSESGDVLRIAVVGRDATDARLFSKVWRFVWYKDSGPTLQLTRRQQVEHRAYMLLLADRSGATVPELVAAGTAGDHADALIVTADPPGVALADAPAGAVTDAVLDDAWRNLTRLHDARIAHGSLEAADLSLLDDGTTALLDLSQAAAGATPERLHLDEAALLCLTASVAGTTRAVDAAGRALGTEGFDTVLPFLQENVLPRTTLRMFPDAKAALEELREQAAARAGTDVPEPAALRRVSWPDILMAAGAILGVYLLIGELAQIPSGVFDGAELGWVAVAALLSQLPQIAGAVAVLGSVADPLPFRAVVMVQFANNFTGLVGGTAATTALVIRFFQKQGRAVAVAVSSGLLNTTAAFVVQIVLVVVGLVFTGSDFDLSSVGGGGLAGLVVILIAAGGVVVGLVLFVPRLRRRATKVLRPQLEAAVDNLRRIAATPVHALMLFGGNLVSQVLFALTLDAALHAYGESLPLLQIIVINSLASVLGGAAPVPGGMGVVEAGLIGGFTAAGIPESEAIATTFTARLFTAYLPPIWGWFALRWMRRRDYV